MMEDLSWHGQLSLFREDLRESSHKYVQGVDDVIFKATQILICAN